MQQLRLTILSSVLLLLCSHFVLPTALAATYWVSPTGSDSNSCASVSGSSDPGRYRKTIKAAASCLTSGDKLFIKNGIYAEQLTNHLPSGINNTSPTIMEGESTTGVIIRPASGTGNVILINQPRQYLTFRNFTVDAVNMRDKTYGIRSSGGATNYFILEQLEIKNTWGASIICGDGAQGWLIRRNKVHTTVAESAIYHQCSNSIIEHNEVSNIGANGIIIQSNSHETMNNTVRFNYIHDIGKKQPGCCRGITMQETNTLVHNNLIIPGGTNACVKITGGSNGRFFNNTCYGGGIGVLQSGGTNFEVKNNIIWGNSGSKYQRNGGAEIVFSRNLCSSGSICEITSDPLFVDAQKRNFRVRLGSPAIDKGTTVSLLKADADGTTLPQGCCYDIGAYEYTNSGAIPPVSPGALQAVSR